MTFCRRHTDRHRRRGFVTILAISLIALVAVALAAHTHRVRAAARQAGDARRQAQVEQLILAGIAIAREKPVNAPRTVPLPPSLGDARLTLTPQGNRVVIDVAFESLKVRQTIGLDAGGTPRLVTDAP